MVKRVTVVFMKYWGAGLGLAAYTRSITKTLTVLMYIFVQMKHMQKNVYFKIQFFYVTLVILHEKNVSKCREDDHFCD